MAKLPPRLLGVVLLAGAGGSTLIHRNVYEAARHGPAQVAEFGLGLLTFILASTGILLLIHGAKLFAPISDRLHGEDLRARTAFRARLEAPLTPHGRAFDTRQGASMMQARYRIGRSWRARSVIHSDPGTPERAPIDWISSPRR